MDDVLDNKAVLTQKDSTGALDVVAAQPGQAIHETAVMNAAHDGRPLTGIVVTGMGGSALAALIAKTLLVNDVSVPLDIVRGYALPAYVSPNTLVIASSYSGNTEETLSALEQARQKGAQLAIVASGGALIEAAVREDIMYVQVPGGMQPRMSTIANLRALFSILHTYGLVDGSWNSQLEGLHDWLVQQAATLAPETPTEQNDAKRLAHKAIGKTPVFYGGPLTAPLAYKFKISWNETAKNMAFWNEYPEFNHNEIMGWTSHPVEKPFIVFDVVSSLETARIKQRFELTDRLLSGQRPHANVIELRGDTLMAQLLYGAILADFASVYAGVLNGVDPAPVVVIEKLKQELAADPR